MRDGYAVNGDLRMYYQVHGTVTDRTPLLLIHGGGGTIETNWGALMPSFAAEREVVAVEEEGHGRSRPVDREHNLDAAGQDVVAVLDELGLPAVDVLAFSAGTLTAIAMALANPRRVGRMILASTPWRRDAMIEGFWDGFEHATLDSMPQLFKDEYLRLNPGGEHLQTFFDLDVHRVRDMAGWSDEDVRGIHSPTLVVAADRDVVTVEGALRLSRAVPHGRLLIVPGNHGNYIGERLASEGDLSTMDATSPLLVGFLNTVVA